MTFGRRLVVAIVRGYRAPLLRPVSNAWRGVVHPSVGTCFHSAAFAAAPSASSEPMVTRHLKIGQIFNKEDDYIFRITQNMRAYEWGRDEVETMFYNIVDSMNEDDEASYELNQIMVLKEGEKIHEVADGQQRLITMCLLYAAIRNVTVDDDLRKNIQAVLWHKELRKEPVPRVTLRERHNDVLKELLEGKKQFRVRDGHPDPVQHLMLKNYFILRDAVEKEVKEDPDFCFNFFKYLKTKVQVYLTIPVDRKTARKLVANGGKGKNAEDVDMFKSSVIFLGIKSEQEQDVYLKRWDALAVEVGRGVLQDSIVLAAQVSLRKMAKKDGILDISEAFWKIYGSDGVSFIQEVIKVNARELHAFRQGNVRQANIDWKSKLQLLFLRDIGLIATAKEIEMAVLSLLCMGEFHKEANKEYVNTALPILERIGLFFAVASVNKKVRCKRVLSIATSIQERKDLRQFDLNKVEEAEVLESLDLDWGETPTKRKVATAILRRLDAARSYKESESIIDIDNITLEHILPKSPRQGSHWKLQWSREDQDRWTHRLGNLAILNGKKNSKAGNEDFMKKRDEIYKAVPFPITADLGKLNGFDPEECRLRHEAIIRECQTDFGLDSHLLRD